MKIFKKDKAGSSTKESGFKKQLVSGGIYIALAAAIVTVTMGSVSKIMNGDMGYEAPDIEYENNVSDDRIILPGIDMYDPVATNPEGVEAKLEENKPDNGNDIEKDDKKPSGEENIGEASNVKEDVKEPAAEAPPHEEKKEEKDNADASDDNAEEQPEETSAEHIGEPDDPLFDGKYYKVADGYINREFSMEKLIYSPTMKDFRTHNGIDITGDPGSPVRAFGNGVITDIVDDVLMGRTVVVDHGDGIVASYSNLSDPLPQGMAVGKSVSGGEILGGIGNTASAESAEVSHVHLSITKDGEYINPKTFLVSEK